MNKIINKILGYLVYSLLVSYWYVFVEYVLRVDVLQIFLFFCAWCVLCTIPATKLEIYLNKEDQQNYERKKNKNQPHSRQDRANKV